MKRIMTWACGVGMAIGLAACEGDGGPDGEPLVEPPVISSEDGVLETELTVAVSPITVGNQTVMSSTYNGLFVPPTLLVDPGDVIRLTLNNQIEDMTNLHYHGMNVTPLNNGDNVFVHVEPEHSFMYEIPLPDQHPEGLFYYHAHMHGLTEAQIGGGMSGGLVVNGLLDPFPQLEGITQRVMLLKDLQIVNGEVMSPPDSSMPTTRTLNGQINPTVAVRPGETQLWSIGNIGADIYYHLRLDNHVFYEVARDGNRHTQLIPRDEILLPTSSRVDVLLQGSAFVGNYPLRTLAINMGPQGDQYPEVTLATAQVAGASETPVALPTEFPPVENLIGMPIAHRRLFQFSENDDGSQFFINNQQFDPNRIDTTVQLGDIEEWTVENCSGENHVFHIHQLDFQVTEVDGVPQPFVGRQDTVNLAFRDTDGQENCPTDADPRGRVKVLMPFTNPVIVGKFVYHCHIGEHEDNGMMQVIEVVDPSATPGEDHTGHDPHLPGF